VHEESGVVDSNLLLFLGRREIRVAAAAWINTAAVIEYLPIRHAADIWSISSQIMAPVWLGDKLEKFQVQ